MHNSFIVFTMLSLSLHCSPINMHCISLSLNCKSNNNYVENKANRNEKVPLGEESIHTGNSPAHPSRRDGALQSVRHASHKPLVRREQAQPKSGERRILNGFRWGYGGLFGKQEIRREMRTYIYLHCPMSRKKI